MLGSLFREGIVHGAPTSEAEEAAGLDHPQGFGFYALTRAWATCRKHLTAQDIAAAGG